MHELKGRRALVCGGSRGIGRACAEDLASRGAAVTVLARDGALLKEVAAHLDAAAGQSHEALVADLSDAAAAAARVAECVERAGPIHILVNNTGGPPSGALLDATPEDFLSAIGRHVGAAHRLVQTLLPGMREAGYGRIINIVSTSVLAPIPGLGVSNTTRAAVANWARTLAHELGPHGVTVNNVLPGFTDTERLRELIEVTAERMGAEADALAEAWRADIPARRFADPAEIGVVVGFLATPAAGYVSGVNLPVDGARTVAR
ncbi:MAG: SDR family oxidoreductase [Gemmatimonadota bacterium]